MRGYTQVNGPIAVTTTLEPDALLLTGFDAREEISQLFHFSLELVALHETKIPFDELVGGSATVTVWLPDGKRRYFNGIINRFAQGGRDESFTYFRAEIVPRLWLLSKVLRSRIFQHVTVPEILQTVLAGLDVKFELTARYEPRNYCVQYHESDLAFASRLMEEEGIHYFFAHGEKRHQMIVTDQAGNHPELPVQPEVIYEGMFGGQRGDLRVTQSEKVQELRSGKYLLWDHTFELPHKHLDATRAIMDSVAVGTVTHALRVGGNDQLELYEFPGGYAKRFDGIDKGGGERPAEVEKIFTDNERTVGIRMQEEARLAVEVTGSSACRHFVPGYQFTLTRHFDGDGPYLLTRVEHRAQCSVFRTDAQPSFQYENRFTCIPAGLPYRPLRVTPKPVMPGPQSAVVVGPAGEEIFCDKYGRVKVQFHWDREGKYDADSSCWVRVSHPWAGHNWGAISIPRIGQEVIVDFLEGDPDQPVITGRVYNAEAMPPYALPAGAVVSGIKSNSTKGGGGYNEVSMNDTKGKEHVTIHAQYDMSTTVEHDDTQTVHNNRVISVDGTHTETIKKDTSVTVAEGKETNTVNKEILITSQTAHIYVKASTEIKLEVGSSKLHMFADGRIELSGVNIAIDGSAKVRTHGAEVTSEADSQHQTKGSIVISEGTATNTVKGGMVMLNP